MRIILISADKDPTRVQNLAKYLKAHYKIAHVFSMSTRRADYTRKVIEAELNVNADIIYDLGTKIKKRTKINYEETKHLLTELDLSTRSELYKQIYEAAQVETDAEISKRLLLFYQNTLLKKLVAINAAYESVSLAANSKDIAVICDHYTANSIVEAVYRINKYHAYSRTNVDNINMINANISVINTQTDLLEFYNYSNFI